MAEGVEWSGRGCEGGFDRCDDDEAEWLGAASRESIAGACLLIARSPETGVVAGA
jgi:hypothetical protein